MSKLIVHRHENYLCLTIPANSKIAYLNAVAKKRLERELPIYFHFLGFGKIKIKHLKNINDKNIYKYSINKNTICCGGIPDFLMSNKRQVFRMKITNSSINLIDVSQSYQITIIEQ